MEWSKMFMLLGMMVIAPKLSENVVKWLALMYLIAFFAADYLGK